MEVHCSCVFDFRILCMFQWMHAERKWKQNAIYVNISYVHGQCSTLSLQPGDLDRSRLGRFLWWYPRVVMTMNSTANNRAAGMHRGGHMKKKVANIQYCSLREARTFYSVFFPIRSECRDLLLQGLSDDPAKESRAIYIRIHV